MLRSQVEARGVTNASVLEAMRLVPRHLFVPEKYRAEAYADHPLSIGEGQTISQPYIVGLMTQLLEVNRYEKILEIGTGSGYQTAILAELGAKIYTVELFPDLAAQARRTLEQLGYQDIHYRVGDGSAGWAEHAPYDGIIAACAPEEVPKALLEQLAESGRLVIPVGVQGAQVLQRIRKEDGRLVSESVLSVSFVPMLTK
jgi:protein-L-isoaspartate(D-aspartate) O-methyltransferase